MLGPPYSQSWHWEEIWWLVLRSATFTPKESPRYSFSRRLSGPQEQSGHERAKKNLHPLRHPGSNPGRPARSPAPFRLNYLDHITYCTVTFVNYMLPNNFRANKVRFKLYFFNLCNNSLSHYVLNNNIK